jgi:hypothetical protein
MTGTSSSSGGRNFDSDILLSYEDGAMELWKVDLSAAGCSTMIGMVSQQRTRTRSELSTAGAERNGEEVEEDVTVSLPSPSPCGALQYREEVLPSLSDVISPSRRRKRHVINLYSFHPSENPSASSDESAVLNKVLLYSKNYSESLVGIKWASNHANVSNLLLLLFQPTSFHQSNSYIHTYVLSSHPKYFCIQC